MRKSALSLLCLLLICCRLPVYAEDMRADYVKMREQQEAVLRQAEAAARQAETEAEQNRQAILKDKNSLDRAIADLEQKNRAIEQQIAEAENRLQGLTETGQRLEAAYAETAGVVREIIGYVRTNARDMVERFRQSPQSALAGDRQALAQDLADAGKFPAMDDIRKMVDLLIQEIELSGQVRKVQGTVIDRSGRTSPAEILMIGNLTVAYRASSETGFALYSDASRRLFALSNDPPFSVNRAIKKYMAGDSEAVYLDISGGAALRQLTHKLSLMAQIPRGGPIVWPILLIFVLGAGIAVERFRYLGKRNCDAEDFMSRVTACVRQDDWTACRDLCRNAGDKSVPKVIYTALDYRQMSREDMENALQEAILNQVPRLERFLSTLGMLAAIAPLLGLLGTVTGMINTFHAITYYGTGDPRMMSGGISEALVTTMLGLCVAIPLMLAHTLLSRRVENIIGQMEEKAVSFVNQVFKTRAV